MFFLNFLAFLMIPRMLAIWSLVPLAFLSPAEHLEVLGSFTIEASWCVLCCIIFVACWKHTFLSKWAYSLWNPIIFSSTCSIHCYNILNDATLILLDCKEIKPVNPKGINPEYSLKGPMLKLKLQYFDRLMWRANSLEKILMLDPDAFYLCKRRRGWQRMRWLDSITYSMDMNLSKFWEYWRTEEPGMLQSMRLQLSNWTTQLFYYLEKEKFITI